MKRTQDIIEQMTALETTLDQLAQQRKIGQGTSIQLLDQYYDLFILYFNTINEVDNFRKIQLQQLKIVPINFEERLSYIEERKHHYMGYQQMKTLKSELRKMYAAYRARHGLF
ncbi:YpoC family protein [Staphylococcus lutrae]|uniref:YpoC-like domain-containing protein n=1 Tax=Staphylococcus lutrae TaxID=155085 RepID=A0AAC9RVW5_9STAP|nr:hypothetical protein [Staphylococcus lutrae]ARJ51865.1 hypothetical protein B5P37_11320 [Staphylococcus lutrae]PNZ35930.1 hypothetical protein CD134_08600 [Staphylococcus lutrae]